MPGPGDIPALGERCDYDGGVAEEDAILIADDCLESIATLIEKVRASLVRRDIEQAANGIAETQNECSKALDALRRFC